MGGYRLKRYSPLSDEAFHIHTWRCKHAEDIDDSAYVVKALELGVSRIVFTDHAPFPGDPFGNRMDISQLSEYTESMRKLKDEFLGRIEVLTGLEIEFLPSFIDYYYELKDNPGLDLLILGQHFYEHATGEYSFMDDDKSGEYIGLCEAMIRGIETGLFDVVAHPDRAFRRRKHFEEEEERISEELIHAASEHGVCLEINYSSVHRKRQFWPEFWKLIPSQDLTIYGLDAHSIEELETGLSERITFDIAVMRR